MRGAEPGGAGGGGMSQILRGLADKERAVSSGQGAGAPTAPPAPPFQVTGRAGTAQPKGPTMPPGGQLEPQGPAAGVARAVTPMLVPTPAGVGAGAAQLVRPAIARWMPRVALTINRLPLPLQRIILGSGGGAVGARLAGDSAMGGAAEGMIGTAASEVVGKVTGLHGVSQKRAGNVMARDLGKLAHEVSGGSIRRGIVAQDRGAPLPTPGPGQTPHTATRPPRSPEDLRTAGLHTTPIGEEMGNIQRFQTAKAQGLLTQSGAGTFTDPTRPAPPIPAQAQALLNLFNPADPTHQRYIQQIYANHNIQPRRYTLSQIDERLEELGAIAYPRLKEGSPAEMASQAADARVAKAQITRLMNHLETEMTSIGAQQAHQTWLRGRYSRSAGLAILDVLEKGGWFKPGTASGFTGRKGVLDTAALQKEFQKPGVLDNLRERMSPADYRSLVAIVWRGADPVTTDVTTKGLLPSVLGWVGMKPDPKGSIKYTGIEPFTHKEWAQIGLSALTTDMIDKMVGTISPQTLEAETARDAAEASAATKFNAGQRVPPPDPTGVRRGAERDAGATREQAIEKVESIAETLRKQRPSPR